ncbi:TolC family protein [Myxococcaceae bacterium GXIMD 01537]
MLKRLAVAALGLVTVLLWPRPGAAQPSSELSLEEALALARQRTPILLEASGRVAEARGRVAGASPLLRENPNVELGAGPRELSDGTRALDFTVGLSQTVELGGKRSARLDSAHAAVAGATANHAEAQRQVLGEVASTFLRALHARERLRLARTTQEAARALLHSTQRRLEAGDVPAVDVNLARITLARASAVTASAEGDVTGTLAQLRVLLGMNANAPLGVRGDLEVLATQPLEAPEPLPARPDILALEAQLAEARADRNLGIATAWPDVGIGVRYENEGNETVLLGTLNIPLPVFARGQEARVTSDARARWLEQALELARSARRVEAEAALTRFRQLREAAELLRVEAMPVLADNEGLALKAYEAGELSLAEFFLLRREALDTRIQYLDHLLDAALARVNATVEIGALP